jgi:homoserine O-acetyltransferase/O-succinyltransferase
LMDWPQNGGEFRLGDFQVQSGEVIRDARLVWKTYGTLTPERDNVVLYPCSYGAKHDDMEWLIGSDGILDPTRWFIVIPNMFSNGVSSGPADSPDYPTLVTPWDNVHAQHRLLIEQFGPPVLLLKPRCGNKRGYPRTRMSLQSSSYKLLLGLYPCIVPLQRNLSEN